MPGQDYIIGTRSNSADFRAMSSKASNVRTTSADFKCSTTRHAVHCSCKSEFQDPLIEVDSESSAFIFQEKRPMLSQSDTTENEAISNPRMADANKNVAIDCIKQSLIENRMSDINTLENEQGKETSRKTTAVLNTLLIKELRLLTEQLAQTVNEVSCELVSLLQENDTLRQEIDARNIAIEQLLKMTVKQAEAELRIVKMPVISSSEESDDEWD